MIRGIVFVKALKSVTLWLQGKLLTKDQLKKVQRPDGLGNVTEHSKPLDLEQDVFKNENPKKIAESLKRSAKHSKRKKSGPYQSAMAMLNFYINRGGKNLSKKEKAPLEKARVELRKLFHRHENQTQRK